MTTTATELRVWVGCLACYNAGDLVGHWVDASEAGEKTSADIHSEALAASGGGAGRHDFLVADEAGMVFDDLGCPHEELWVMDHEGFGDALTGECSPCEAQRIAEALDAIPDYIPMDAFSAYASHIGESVTEVDVEDFEESYRGEWGSVAEYAQSFAEETGAFQVSADRYGDERIDLSNHWPFDCIDWDAAARSLDLWTAPADGYNVHVFESH